MQNLSQHWPPDLSADIFCFGHRGRVHQLALHGSRALQAAKDLLQQKFATGKNRWFFTKLRF